MDLINMLAEDNYIVVNKELAKLFGIEGAVLLGELCSEHMYWKKLDGLDEDGYFYSTIENIYDNTTILEHKQRSLLKTMKEMNVVDVKVKGLPAKRYIKINERALRDLLDNLESERTSSSKMEELDTPKRRTNNNNINNNKELFNTKVLNTTEKPKKKNLYEKCLDVIDERYEDEQIKNALVSYLNVRISNKDKPLYNVNVWKKILDKLNSIQQDTLAVINQSIEHDWATFYELPSYSNKKVQNKFGETKDTKSVKVVEEIENGFNSF